LPSAEANSASDISDNTDQKIVDNADTDAFSKRFIFNRTLALKNNLATIKSLFLNAKIYQKTAEEPFEQTVQRITEASTLADALLADEDKKVLAELLEGIEKEIAESNYSIKSVVDRLKAVVSILSV
jgi:two-component sensor histidine kinase